jgi:NADPH-dependent 2,4-dienoyl-CoA reductase/sulfur reductase-like enzyme
MGRVAGTNAAGGGAVYKGVLGTTVIKVFEMGLAKTGFTEAELKSRGVPYDTITVVARDRAHYYPGGGRFTVKLNWERGTGKLLGGSMVGLGPSVLRINALATALYAGLTVEDLARQDLAYAPPFSPVWDPLLVAANKGVRD